MVSVVAIVGRGLCDGRRNLVAVVHRVALSLSAGQVSAQSVNLLFHFSMLGALSDALEVGFDLAIELEADAARAALKRVLDNITSQLKAVERRD